MAKKQEVALKDSNSLVSFDDAPDYLGDTKGSGLESLGQGDFKTPRIKLLQPLSPEIQSFPGKAIPGEFWHTGVNKSLGSEFTFIPCTVGKRVILWQPREAGGGMLAFSRDGINWEMGGGKDHIVKIKNVKTPVVWHTGKNVPASGLLEWGSYNPDDEESGPAAQLSYEYLVYLPDHPELSPVVMGLFKTALKSGKQFNTSLLALRKPIQCIQARCFADAQSNNDGDWHVPAFELQGYVGAELFKTAKTFADRYANYTTEYDQNESQNGTKSDSDQY